MHDPEDTTDYTPHFEALEAACRFFQSKLRGSSTENYLRKERGLTPETLEQFRIGQAEDDWYKLISNLHPGFDMELLVGVGLCRNRHGEYGSEEEHKICGQYDYFRHRAMFPLFNPNKNVIGFIGRSQDETNIPRYLNTPETDLFCKSSFLYAGPSTIETIRSKNEAVIVEGVLDVIRPYQEGLTNLLATLGIAITKNHINLIDRIIPGGDIVFCFDEDEGGQRATSRGILATLNRPRVYVSPIPSELKDPAGVFEKGFDLRTYLGVRKPAFGWYVDSLIPALDLKGITKTQRFIEEIGNILAPLSEPFLSQHVLTLSERTGIEEDLIHLIINQIEGKEEL